MLLKENDVKIHWNGDPYPLGSLDSLSPLFSHLKNKRNS